MLNVLLSRRESIVKRYLEFSWYTWLVRLSYYVPDGMAELMQEILNKMNEAQRKHIPFTHVAIRGR